MERCGDVPVSAGGGREAEGCTAISGSGNVEWPDLGRALLFINYKKVYLSPYFAYISTRNGGRPYGRLPFFLDWRSSRTKDLISSLRRDIIFINPVLFAVFER